MKCNYIVHEREYYIRNIPIYKIGRTLDLFQRKKAYPKGSVFLYAQVSQHIQLVENHAVILFKTLFKHRKDLGREYFEGDFYSMKRFMDSLIEHYRTAVPDSEILEMERNAVENDSASVIQKYWRNHHEKKIKASIMIQKYFRKYIFNKKNAGIQNFVDENICIVNDKFLKLKDVKKLWNSGSKNNKMKDDEIVFRFCQYLGKIGLYKSALGWQNKDFKSPKQKKIDEVRQNDPIYKLLAKNFIITGNKNDYVTYKDVENVVKNGNLFSTPQNLGAKLTSMCFLPDRIRVNKSSNKTSVRYGLNYKNNC